MAYLMYSKLTDQDRQEWYDALVGFTPGKSRCFLCTAMIQDDNCIYWVTGDEKIFFHRHCAVSFAAHLQSDFTRSNERTPTMTNPTPCDKAEQPYTADADTASPYPWRPGQLGATPQPAPKPVRPDQTFWMVYYYGRTGPAPRHWKYAEALEEADRLAREDTDRLVYILRAEQYALVREVPIG